MWENIGRRPNDAKDKWADEVNVIFTDDIIKYMWGTITMFICVLWDPSNVGACAMLCGVISQRCRKANMMCRLQSGMSIWGSALCDQFQ